MKPSLLTFIAFNSLVLFVPIAMLVLYKRPAWWHYLFSLFLGLVTASLDFASDEVQLSALLLVAFGMFIGFAQPKNAWVSALLIGIWIPLSQSIAVIIGWQPYAPGHTIGSLLALGFAYTGTFVGVFVNRFATRVQPTRERKI